ncbi:hypothetical protein BJF80_07690 [Serinicoccus sp. CUA-874]|nr:hypothetical protein BJF80_07690 [Serinicoccus sp. CUA-874]
MSAPGTLGVCRATRRGWLPTIDKVAVSPESSSRTRSTGPAVRSSRTLCTPDPTGVRTRSTGQRSDDASHPASRSQLGQSGSPATTARCTGSNGSLSREAASRARHRVILVQVRSVSPGR